MDNLANRNIKITRNTISNNNNKMDILTKRNIHTKNNDNITPLIPLDPNVDKKETISISTMDIETMNYKGLQIPVAISIVYNFNEKKLFLIDSKLLKTDLDEAINKLWEDYFFFVKNNIKYFKNIVVHNLGSFDGYFIYKGLTKLFPAFISTIIDNNNKFIQITFKYDKFKINWKDSYRIYPISLDDLCKTFNVEGKINKYDIRFNNLDLFNNLNLLKKFKEYSIQDSVCLLNALLNAQDLYFKDHNVDPVSQKFYQLLLYH
nr:DNA polymerase [Lentinula edodes]WEX32046.1 DNA polymerase [Lentinula edodes]